MASERGGIDESDEIVRLGDRARTSKRHPDSPLASPEDFAIPICGEDGPEVLDAVRRHHDRWKAIQEATP